MVDWRGRGQCDFSSEGLEGLEGSRSSDQSTVTVGLNSQGSVTSDATMAEGDGDGEGDGERASGSGEEGEERGMGRTNTLQTGTSWKDVTIRGEDIRFGPNSRLRPGGLFGETHKGYHHQDVAVKFLHMHHVHPEDRLHAFKAEVGMLKNTRHENVVLFMGYILAPPRLGIVLNFCNGLSLHALLHEKRERPELSRALTIATQVAQGMSYLHGKRILHKVPSHLLSLSHSGNPGLATGLAREERVRPSEREGRHIGLWPFLDATADGCPVHGC